MNVMIEQTLTEPIDERQERSRGFSRYQSILVALLALVQFTIIIDFMIMSPLGAIMMPALDISAAQFGVAVSAYAFSAGVSGILAAGFADRFDRKRLLLFLWGLYPWNSALRHRSELPCTAVGPSRHRVVRRRDRLHCARHRHRSVSTAIARPGHGLPANRLRRKPGAWHPDRSFSRQPLELARRVRRIGRSVDRRDGPLCCF
jgi:hypothetical protein